MTGIIVLSAASGWPQRPQAYCLPVHPSFAGVFTQFGTRSPSIYTDIDREKEMRQSLGTAVFAGMLGVTGFGLLFTPAFYAVVRKIGRKKPQADPTKPRPRMLRSMHAHRSSVTAGR